MSTDPAFAFTWVVLMNVAVFALILRACSGIGARTNDSSFSIDLRSPRRPLTSRLARFGLASGMGLFTLTAAAQTYVPVQNGTFDGIGGGISGVLDLNALDPAPSASSKQLGSSGWYGTSNVTTLGNLGFRPGIEVNYTTASLGKGYINYGLGAGLGGLAGLEMPDAYLWQPLTGWSLAPNTTYAFSMDMDSTSLLDLSALTARGFGLGITTGSTSSNPGTFYRDTQTTPSLLSLTLLGGTAQRMVMTFTTGSAPPTGDLGIAAFAGRGTQAMQTSLLTNYTFDNASLAVVPEPATPVIVLFGAGLLLVTRNRNARNLR